MIAAIAHRGPDGQHGWINGPLGLGHRMLWTTPESLRERLPLRNSTGTLVITADARLDNRHELMAALDIPLHSETSDSALILAAYEQWDERCPEKLLGDFAFALWDERKQVLFGARDHLGVKPFYYYRSSRAFIFASEIKALLCLPGVPRRLNEVRVADYLVPMLEDNVITFYQDILRLPPAHTITVSPQGASVRPYWSLDPTREMRCGSREDHYRRLTSGLIPFVLEVIDRAAAAFALESRHPLVDKRLAEYCLALPPQQKLSQGWRRMVMRRALATVLPTQVQWRGDKSNVAPNFTRGLLTFERGLLEEVILSDPKVIEAYVDVAALREVFHRYLSHKRDDDVLTIWRAATLALWLRHTGLISQSTSTNAGRSNDNRGEGYG